MPETLHFIRPWWLLLAPLGMICCWQLLRRRPGRANWRRVCDPHLAELLLVERGGRAWLPRLGLLLLWLLAALALAGPTWQQLPQPLAEALRGRVLALDLSRSMDLSLIHI